MLKGLDSEAKLVISNTNVVNDSSFLEILII